MKFIIIHGSYGNSKENWFPWLKSELKTLGHKVEVPNFPNPPEQNLNNWMKTIENYKIDEDTVLIGHSLGVAFILNLLEKHKVKAVFLVSGFVGKLDLEKFDLVNKTFAEKEFDWARIKSNVGNVFIYHSDNDPYVPMKKAESLAEKLYVKVKIIHNAGHINAKAGYIKFELLLEDLKKFLLN